MRAAYKLTNALEAEATLAELARQLDRSHPGAAGSLREGLAETLTVMHLGVPPTLARTLRSTNAIESMIEICRDHSTNVKNWRDGTMALRWCAAGMGEAAKQFRRVNGHLHLPALRAALEAEAARRRGATVTTPQLPSERGLNRPPTVTEVPRNSGHPPFGLSRVVCFGELILSIALPCSGEDWGFQWEPKTRPLRLRVA